MQAVNDVIQVVAYVIAESERPGHVFVRLMIPGRPTADASTVSSFAPKVGDRCLALWDGIGAMVIGEWPEAAPRSSAMIVVCMDGPSDDYVEFSGATTWSVDNVGRLYVIKDGVTEGVFAPGWTYVRKVG